MTIDPNTLIERPDGSVIPFGKLRETEQLTHELVLKLMPRVEALNASLTAFKRDTLAELLAYRDLMFAQYGAKVGGRDGNMTIRSACGRWMVRLQVSKFITFGEELEAAKALIFACLADWAEGAGEELRHIVTRVFALNSKGRIDTQGILNLRNLPISDQRWIDAMRAIEDAIRRDHESIYIYFYRVDPATGAETRIPLDIAKL